MNGMPYTSGYIGALGEYPIYDYINLIDSNQSNFITSTSNLLEQHSSNNIAVSSTYLQTQITNTCNLIYKDANLNTIVKITAQNPYYPVGNSVETQFQNVNGSYLTKIIQTGELMVYHPAGPLPAGYSAGWWGVENKIANGITDTQGLRFDVTNLQAATGAAAITDTTAATAAAAGAAGGLATVGGVTAASGAAIAGGNIGSVALGVAGGALFSVLGYLSYQAQVASNLTSNGFLIQASQVQSNINSAYILLTDNISNICIAKGFINCNIKTPQYISKVVSDSITYKGIELSNLLNNTSNYINNLSSSTNTNFINTSNYVSSKFLPLTGGIMSGQITGITTVNASTGIYGTISTTNNTNKAIPSVGNFGGLGDKIVYYNGTSTTYPYSLGIETNALWLSSPSDIKFYNNGSNSIIISSNGEFIATNRIKENSQYLSDVYATNINTSNFINTNVSSLYNYINVNNTYTSNFINSNIWNTSNYINTSVINMSNYCLNINNNTSNFIRKINVLLPHTSFWYDYINNLQCYDLNIEKYVPSINLGGYKSRSFRITTYVPATDWRTGWNLLYNNQYINFPETLTIHMNNNSNLSGFSSPNDNYANGIILGKTQNTNVGYWNFVPNNYNYIRYISYLGWDTNIIIEALN